MKILLINPPIINELKSQVSKRIEEESGFQPPLGIMYIASYVRERSDHEVKILDAPVERLSYRDMERFIGGYQPDIVGITTTTFTMVDVLLTAETVKKINNSIKVCLGGAHVDIYPEETIRLPNIDFLIQGEGERPFLELVNALQDGGDLSLIKGLVFWEDGQICINGQSTANKDLDSLPFPARDLTPWEKYYSIVSNNRPTTNLLSSKGCPYNCIFCYKHAGRAVRYREIKMVVDEMEQCFRMGIREIFFEDETFTLDRNRSLSFYEEIKSRGLKIPWGARARVNLIDREILEKFREVGCQRLHIGVEAGTEKILKVLRKNITLDQTREVFKNTRELGITTVAYFMLGSPEETREDILKTIEFVCEIDPDYVQFSKTTPFPATELYHLGLKSGLFTHDYWKEFAQRPNTQFTPQLWEQNLAPDELERLVRAAQKRFYTRPKYIFRKLRDLNSIEEFKKKAKAGLRMVFG